MKEERFLAYESKRGFSCSKCGKTFTDHYEKALEQFHAHVCSMQGRFE